MVDAALACEVKKDGVEPGVGAGRRGLLFGVGFACRVRGARRKSPDLVATVVDIVRVERVTPGQLMFEITETVAMQDACARPR
jgi:hypothetical protein